MPAIDFDCDGVLAESERDGHLAAFNRAFAEFGLPVRWSEEEYGEKLLVSEAALVLSSLGDPDEPMEVLADRSAATPADSRTLGDLEALLGFQRSA